MVDVVQFIKNYYKMNVNMSRNIKDLYPLIEVEMKCCHLPLM